MNCLGTNFVYSFILFKNEAYNLIEPLLFVFQNSLIDLLTPKGSHYIKKYNAILHRILG